MQITDKLLITNEDNMDMMARYPDKYFELAIVDPPYGIERFKKASLINETTGIYAKRGSFKSKYGQNWNNKKPTIQYFNELFRISKNQIIWGANNFTLPETEYFVIWDKMQFMENFASAEYGWVSVGLKKPAKVFRFSIHKENAYRIKQGGKINQAQKPIELYKWLLHNYAKPGDKILDTHLGSGSIAIACHDYGFELTACELDKEYYDAAIKRIKNHVSQLKLF